jgi:hypothetical protein
MTTSDKPDTTREPGSLTEHVILRGRADGPAQEARVHLPDDLNGRPAARVLLEAAAAQLARMRPVPAHVRAESAYDPADKLIAAVTAIRSGRHTLADYRHLSTSEHKTVVLACAPMLREQRWEGITLADVSDMWRRLDANQRAIVLAAWAGEFDQ